MTYETSDGRFDRLQNLILAMQVGDELHPRDAARISGLSQHICEAMLEGLTRAGLMSKRDDGLFTRRSLDVLAL